MVWGTTTGVIKGDTRCLDYATWFKISAAGMLERARLLAQAAVLI